MSNKPFYAIVEFEDGLQIVPNNWLSSDLQSAVWPVGFTNNASYDRAVKLMENPKPMWLSHPIKKIYGTCPQYAVARKKLKEAEEISDINSGTDRDELLKRSRKFRAAKVVDSSQSSSSESSDGSFVSDMPTFPTTSKVITKNILKKQKTGKEDSEYIDTNNCKNARDVEENAASYERLKKTLKKHASQPQCSSFSNVEHENYDNAPVLKFNQNWNSKDKCTRNLFHNEESNIADDNNPECDIADNNNSPAPKRSTIMQSPQLHHEQKNFHKFVIHELIHLQLAVDDVKKNQKLVLQTLQSIRSSFDTQEKENLYDTFNDFPLKDQNDLDTMEIKLKNDLVYRGEMMKQLARILSECMKTSCLRLMRLIFSNQLAINYSWHGAKKKKQFSTLNICKVIISVIQKSHTNATNDQISAPIKIWLAHAKERLERQHPNRSESQPQNQNQIQEQNQDQNEQ